MSSFILEVSSTNAERLERLLKRRKIAIVNRYIFNDTSAHLIKINVTRRVYMNILKSSCPSFVIVGTEHTVPELAGPTKKIKKR